MENIDPKYWGPYGWKFLHTLTLYYPDIPSNDDKKNIVNFLHTLSYVLPCETCRHEFKKLLKKYPPEEYNTNKTILIRWLYNIHNKVNKRLEHKPYVFISNEKLQHDLRIDINKPETWGSVLWKLMHMITLTYKKNPRLKDKQRMQAFFYSLLNIIPNKVYKEEFEKQLILTPLDDNILVCRCNLIKWLVNIHNQVNKKLGKPLYNYNNPDDFLNYLIKKS